MSAPHGATSGLARYLPAVANPNARPLDMLRRLPDADAWERRLFGDLDAAVAAHSSSSGDEPPPGPPPP